MTEELNLGDDRSKDSVKDLTANIITLLSELSELQQESQRNAMRLETIINQIGFEVGYMKGKGRVDGEDD